MGEGFSFDSGFANERLQIIIMIKESERNRAVEEIHFLDYGCANWAG